MVVDVKDNTVRTLAQTGIADFDENIRLLGNDAYLRAPHLQGHVIGGKLAGSFGEVDFSAIDGIDPTHHYQVFEFQRRSFLIGNDKADVSRLIRVYDKDTQFK